MKTRAADLKSKTAYIIGAQGKIDGYRNQVGKLRNDIRGKGGPAKGEAKRALADMAKEIMTADRMLLGVRLGEVNDYEPKKAALDKALTELARLIVRPRRRWPRRSRASEKKTDPNKPGTGPSGVGSRPRRNGKSITE